MHRLIITFIYHQVLFLLYFNILLIKITIIYFLFLESHIESIDSKDNLNDYSETDFSNSIDTHRLNTELLKLQV